MECAASLYYSPSEIVSLASPQDDFPPGADIESGVLVSSLPLEEDLHIDRSGIYIYTYI
jgi:hypothetical protein